MKITKPIMLVLALILITGKAFAADVVVTPSNNTVIQGQTFDLNISIDPLGTAIAGAQLNIEFNKSIISINSITEGDLFKQNGAGTFFNNGTISNSLGTVINIFDAIIGPANVSTPGTFIIINVTATGSSGTCGINLSNVIISDPYGNNVALNVANGSITITPQPVLAPIDNKIVDDPLGELYHYLISLERDVVQFVQSYL